MNFNPLPPHGGRPNEKAEIVKSIFISIHSLHTEGDHPRMRLRRMPETFQSTPSTRRETPHYLAFMILLTFQSTPSTRRETCAFSHHSPNLSLFQSTPSTRRETICRQQCTHLHEISIHSLHTEGDPFTSYDNLHPIAFQSTPSTRREILEVPESMFLENFNPLPPHGGRRKTAQESVFHFAYPCTILQKRMQKTTFCTRKNDFFRKKGEKFGAKPPASFCAPMIRTDIFPQTSLTESAALPCLWFPLHRYVPPSTDNDFPGNKTAGCPFLYQSPVPADA